MVNLNDSTNMEGLSPLRGDDVPNPEAVEDVAPVEVRTGKGPVNSGVVSVQPENVARVTRSKTPTTPSSSIEGRSYMQAASNLMTGGLRNIFTNINTTVTGLWAAVLRVMNSNSPKRKPA